MEAYYDPMRLTLHLTDTVLEALEYLDARILEWERNDSSKSNTCSIYNSIPIYLLSDIIEAYFAMNLAYGQFARKMEANRIEELSEDVLKELVVLFEAVKAENGRAIGQLIGIKLLPAFRSYRQEMAECFNPYILC